VQGGPGYEGSPGPLSRTGRLCYSEKAMGKKFQPASALFALGFAATAFQTLLLREGLVTASGNELAVSLLLTAWLAGVALGAFLARSVRFLSRWYPTLFAAGLILWAFWIVPARLAREIWTVPSGGLPDLWACGIHALVITAFPGLLVGLLFPLAMSWSGWDVRRAFIVESIGSMGGGVVITFLLIPFTSPVGQIGWILALSGFLVFRPPGMVLSVLSLLFCLSPFSTRIDGELETLRWRSMDIPLALRAMRQTPYQHLALTGMEDEIFLYLNGQVAGTCPDPYGADLRIRPLLAQSPHPGKILLLGGMPGVDAQALVAPAVKEIDHVNTDPELAPFLQEYCPVPLDPLIRTVARDPIAFVREASGPYDLILSLMPDPSSVFLNRAFTRECFQQYRRILAPDGVAAVRISSGVNYIGEESAEALHAVVLAAKEVFPDVHLLPGEETFILMGGEGSTLTLNPHVLMERSRTGKLGRQTFSPEIFPLLYPRDRVIELEKRMESCRSAMNTENRPTAVLWTLGQSQKLAGKPSPWQALARLPAALLAVGLLLLFGIVMVLLRNHPPLYSVTTSGAGGMGGALLLLYAFQSRAGFLYGWIGLLTAIFMAGLCLGGLLSRRMTLLRGDILMALSLLLLLLPIQSPLLFLGAMVLLGIGTGIPFPLAGRHYGDDLRAASLAEGFDHGGAMAGALLAGILLYPVAGYTLSILFFVAIKLSSLVLSVRSS